MESNGFPKKDGSGLKKYLTPLGAWALAFGCAVGWGSFVMPGTTFLPIAGPLGTVAGIAIGALIMLIIGVNYHFLMNKYPDAGGTYTYTKINFGFDHGFLSGWFLALVYVAIIWANATALPLIARNLLGGVFQVGFCYEIAGFQVYLGETALAIAALVIGAAVCLRAKAAERTQIVMALTLLVGIVVCFIAVMTGGAKGETAFSPAFPPGKKPLSGLLTIVALAPWAFVGFESISHSSDEFRFKPKKSLLVLVIAVITSGAAYAMLAVMAAAVRPEGVSSWADYIGHLGSYSGLEGLPTFFAAASAMGVFGKVLLALASLGAILTGLIGNYIASSRLLYALSQDKMLPSWFGKLNKNQVPRNAILFIMGVSLLLPFCGRTAISWIVDVTTVGATIAYAYTSATALRVARKEKNKAVIVFGGLGVGISLLFAVYFLVPNLMAVTTLSAESYLILAAWSILGFVFFLFLFKRDTTRRLGRSTVNWVVLLALIIFTSTIWMRQSTEAATEKAVQPIQNYYIEMLEKEGVDIESTATKPKEDYLRDQLKTINGTLTVNILIQCVLIVVALSMMFYIYSMMQKREKQIEVEKVLAEENSRAKTSFLSNMSHEIRTPMNAIIGLDNIALKDPDLKPHTREQLEKIGASAKHLLGLINDILDMSRIESGRMVLKNEEFSFRDFLDQINVMVNGQCVDKGLNYECNIIGNVNDYYCGDDLKLKQVLINILGNAVKFTPAPGRVTLTVEQTQQFEGHRALRFIVKDTGIGMSKEFIPKIFDAFTQEQSGASNKYGSTGLGMAITKNIVGMMNGDIEVESEKGKGSTFTVTVTLKSSSRTVSQENGSALPRDMRALVVDDDEVACEHARLVASAIGLETDAARSGDEALGRILKERERGKPYQLVLTDYKMSGIDGLNLTRAIRAFDHGEMSVIILTGYNWEDMRDEVKAAGADGILSKPLFTDSLIREIQRVLQTKAPKNQAEAERQDEALSPGSLSGRRVLIAEDMDINAEILLDILDMEGMFAERAENGQIAVKMFSSQPENYYDAVLMDVRMPVMGGLDATRGIRALDRPDAKTVPIIALTANAFDDDVHRSLQAGMNAHLSKPVEPHRLYETLNKLIKHVA